MIMEHPQNESSKGISTLLLPTGPQGNYDDAVWAVVEEQYLLTVPVPVHSMESFYNSAAEPDRELLKLSVRANFEATHKQIR